MPAISKPPSRKRAEPATALAFVRQLGSTRALRGASRHLGWAAGISARLTERKLGLGWNSGWKVLARATRNYILLRELIRQLQPVSSSHASGTRLSKNRQRSCGCVQNITQLHITAVNPAGMHPASRAHETPHHHGFRAVAPFAGSFRNRAPATSIYFALWPRMQAASAHFFRAASEPPVGPVVPVLSCKRVHVQPWLAPGVIEDGSVAADMPSRVARKHRRLEHHAWPHPEDSAISSEAWPVVSNPRRVHQPQWRQPASDAEVPTPSPQLRTTTQLQAEPVVNVARITDEVIKQLDRRFIAARERRGKI